MFDVVATLGGALIATLRRVALSTLAASGLGGGVSGWPNNVSEFADSQEVFHFFTC